MIYVIKRTYTQLYRSWSIKLWELSEKTNANLFVQHNFHLLYEERSLWGANTNFLSMFESCYSQPIACNNVCKAKFNFFFSFTLLALSTHNHLQHIIFKFYMIYFCQPAFFVSFYFLAFNFYAVFSYQFIFSSAKPFLRLILSFVYFHEQKMSKKVWSIEFNKKRKRNRSLMSQYSFLRKKREGEKKIIIMDHKK